MKIRIYKLLLFNLALFFCSNLLAEKATLSYVSDGDSIVAKINHKQIKVRLIGIDAPELHANEKAIRDSKRSGQDIKTITYLGRKSLEYLRTLVSPGEQIDLVYDIDKFDRFGRTLAYVYLEDGTFLNLKMIEDGYAYPFSIAPNIKYKDSFRDAFSRAQKEKRGLFGE